MRGRRYKLRAIWAPSLLRRIVRHRYVQAAVVLLLGLGSAVALSSRVAALDEVRHSWGGGRSVLVLVEPVEVGGLVAQSVELRDLPHAVIPSGAMREIGDMSQAKVSLYPGEVLLAERVTNGQGAAVRAGTVALTVPVVAQVPVVIEGDLVDLWAVDSANFTSQRVVASVIVLAFSERDITVAVPSEQVADAAAASLRPVIVTLVG